MSSDKEFFANLDRKEAATLKRLREGETERRARLAETQRGPVDRRYGDAALSAGFFASDRL